MVFLCKGYCDNFDDKYDIRRADRDSFKLGYKRCRQCSYYIRGLESRCPCCQSKLAIKARNATSKRLLRQKSGGY
jgi:hypothetical protein